MSVKIIFTFVSIVFHPRMFVIAQIRKANGLCSSSITWWVADSSSSKYSSHLLSLHGGKMENNHGGWEKMSHYADWRTKWRVDISILHSLRLRRVRLKCLSALEIVYSHRETHKLFLDCIATTESTPFWKTEAEKHSNWWEFFHERRCDSIWIIVHGNSCKSSLLFLSIPLGWNFIFLLLIICHRQFHARRITLHQLRELLFVPWTSKTPKNFQSRCWNVLERKLMKPEPVITLQLPPKIVPLPLSIVVDCLFFFVAFVKMKFPVKLAPIESWREPQAIVQQWRQTNLSPTDKITRKLNFERSENEKKEEDSKCRQISHFTKTQKGFVFSDWQLRFSACFGSLRESRLSRN